MKHTLGVPLFTDKLAANLTSSPPSKEASEGNSLAFYFQLLEKFDGKMFPYGDVYVVVNKHGVL